LTVPPDLSLQAAWHLRHMDREAVVVPFETGRENT
jgi:hypothetical protein